MALVTASAAPADDATQDDDLPVPTAVALSGDFEPAESPSSSIPERPSSLPGNPDLRALAPSYVDAEHGDYLRHLETAVEDSKIRNIALSGRYGTGKSSVLEEFERNHESDTFRISISTLGPDSDGEDLTNRIQKELVKQFVYRADRGTLQSSRFARRKALTPLRGLLEASVAAAVCLTLVGILGFWPDFARLLPAAPPAATGHLSLVFGLLVVLVFWGIRWAIGDRMVSQVATAGTTVTLDETPDTYFDKYLDEIVTFFETSDTNFVIFEDLDRFEDPRIFDSLRELNTLINASAHWKVKKQPLRFIYAIKDSLFERLGEMPQADPTDRMQSRGQVARLDTPDEKAADDATLAPTIAAAGTDEAAAAEVERANRTKFFELVIPMVPFMSHRNARDHLDRLLQEAGIPEGTVSRQLLDVVARHTTDMRLLINICNEFLVFAALLLWVDNPAPGITGDRLFALVVYKNFHLADFEKIPARASALDVLESLRNDFVDQSIERIRDTRAKLRQDNEVRRAQGENAARLGKWLLAMST